MCVHGTWDMGDVTCKLKSIRVQLTSEVALRRKILRCTFLHTSKSHSVAPGMNAYRVQKCKWLRLLCCSLLCIFFRGGQANPIQTS